MLFFHCEQLSDPVKILLPPPPRITPYSLARVNVQQAADAEYVKLVNVVQGLPCVTTGMCSVLWKEVNN